MYPTDDLWMSTQSSAAIITIIGIGKDIRGQVVAKVFGNCRATWVAADVLCQTVRSFKRWRQSERTLLVKICPFFFHSNDFFFTFRLHTGGVYVQSGKWVLSCLSLRCNLIGRQTNDYLEHSRI